AANFTAQANDAGILAYHPQAQLAEIFDSAIALEPPDSTHDLDSISNDSASGENLSGASAQSEAMPPVAEFHPTAHAALSSHAASPPGVNLIGIPTWQDQGPASIINGSLQGITDLPVSGAIQTIAIHPADPNRMLVGSVNGGIWRTLNARWPSDGVDNDGNGVTDFTDRNGDGIPTVNGVSDTDPNRPAGDAQDDTPDPGEAVRWTPLTDQLLSLSISHLAFSPLDNSVIFAGLGRISSAAFAGGAQSGIYKSINGGNDWAHLASATWPSASVTRILPTTHTAADSRQVVIVATADPSNSGSASPDIGLWISRDGGENFAKVAGGLPAGAVTDVLVDPNNNNRFYAAVRQQGIFQGTFDPATDDFTGWVAVNTGIVGGGAPIANANLIGRTLLAAHSSGAPAQTVLYAAISNQNTRQLVDVFRSTNGTNWTPMGPAQTNDQRGGVAVVNGLHPGSQAEFHFSFVAHPTDPEVVFIGGDTQVIVHNPAAGNINAAGSTTLSARIFRGDANPATATPGQAAQAQVWEPIVAGYANGTAPHADSRVMIFDSNGTLLEGDDGGLYRLVNPDQRSITNFPSGPGAVAGNRHWISLNGDLRINELVAVAWDSVTNLMLGGSQDNGSLQQHDRRDNDGDGARDEGDEEEFWRGVLSGDGVAVDVEAQTATQSRRYWISNHFTWAFTETYNSGNNQVGNRTFLGLRSSGSAARLSGLNAWDRNPANGVFSIQYMAVNEVNPRRILFGLSGLYETTSANRGTIIRNITGTLNVAPPGLFNALVYGGKNANGTLNTGLIYASSGNTIYVRPSFTQAFRSANVVGTVVAISVDPNNWMNAFAVTAA
ncbi:MAG: hypothetical protein AB1813_28550, partial [Verrucomicrobiota bacterium]